MKWFNNIINHLLVLTSRKITSANKTFYELEKIAYVRSAAFIDNNLQSALLFTRMEDLWKHAIRKVPKSGLIFEFGVFSGKSINFFSNQIQREKDTRMIYGFDSFQGLSEDWGGTIEGKGTFNTSGNLPKVNDNVKLVVGWIDETLPEFMLKNFHSENKIAFMHIDVDTYGPTRTIFENTIKHFQVGTILVFDELLGYPGYQEHEFKAFKEIVDHSCKYEFIGFCEHRKKDFTSAFISAALKITEIKSL